jgi:hypothetical protein
VVETRLNKPEILMGGEGSYYTSTFVFFVTDGRKTTTTTTTFGAVNNNNSVCDAFHSKTQESKSTRDG